MYESDSFPLGGWISYLVSCAVHVGWRSALSGCCSIGVVDIGAVSWAPLFLDFASEGFPTAAVEASMLGKSNRTMMARDLR